MKGFMKSIPKENMKNFFGKVLQQIAAETPGETSEGICPLFFYKETLSGSIHGTISERINGKFSK